jgi:hypothetical protein
VDYKLLREGVILDPFQSPHHPSKVTVTLQLLTKYLWK